MAGAAIRYGNDLDDSAIAKRIAAAPNVSKVDGVKFLQIHRDAEEAEEGGEESQNSEIVDGVQTFSATGSPDYIVRAMSSVGAARVYIIAKLPPGYYRAVINAQTQDRQEAMKKLAKVYQELFHVQIIQESREVPVLILKADPANAGALKKRTFRGFSSSSMSRGTYRERTFTAAPSGIVETIEQDLHRPVFDETGLKDQYAVKVKFNTKDKPETNLETMRESLAGSGFLLEETTRTIECVTVIPMGNIGGNTTTQPMKK